MKLVATALAPKDPEAAANAVAKAARLTLAEARMRLAREPPALLALLDAGLADALAAELRGSGLAALAVDAAVPSDADRTIARTVAFTGTEAVFAPRSGAPMQLAWGDVVAVFRGAREFRAETDTNEKVTRPSLTAAVVTGGLKLTSTSVKKVHSSEVSTQQVILVYARDGRVALLADDELDFTCLGPRKQPSSTANMMELARALRQLATGAVHDERLLRLGRRPLPFVAGQESRSRTGATSVSRTDTSASLDVLAEVMRQAVAAGLLR